MHVKVLVCNLHSLIPDRGKGEYYRLGSDNSNSSKVPQRVEALSSRKVVQVAVGALHCLALTNTGEVRGMVGCRIVVLVKFLSIILFWHIFFFHPFSSFPLFLLYCTSIPPFIPLFLFFLFCLLSLSPSLPAFSATFFYLLPSLPPSLPPFLLPFLPPSLPASLLLSLSFTLPLSLLPSVSPSLPPSIPLSQVFAWGDNEHGQQGNGSTIANRKPQLVASLKDHRITKIACGSSHSIAFATGTPALSADFSPVSFPTSQDPLGMLLASSRFPNMHQGEDEIKRPSLTKIILSLPSLSRQQEALRHMLTALQIAYARYWLYVCTHLYLLEALMYRAPTLFLLVPHGGIS